MSSLRALPSVDRLLQAPPVQGWIAEAGRALVVEAVRAALTEARQRYAQEGVVLQEGALIDLARGLLDAWTAPSLRPVINATGVILHTNLGRAPLSQRALQAIREAALGYSNLEYDLESGRRGSRLVHAEELLRRLTGAEAALVVNNNAAAVLLVLSVLARRKGVVIARSQLVEIGGGFRIPDVMKQSGAKLVEVGTTNRVHLADYEAALAEENIAAILHTHRSNFQILGFTSEPTLDELSQLARRNHLPLVDDLGSGALLDTACFGLGHEPMVQESLRSGADLVCFSGDKLLGGPQAGIILGRAALVAQLKRHPLARAIRADKLCLAGLSATLLHYLKGEAVREVPIWRMIAATEQELEARARKWAAALGQGLVAPGRSTVGGGSLPGETLPTFLLALPAAHPTAWLAQLRRANPPIIARLEEDRPVFDPRTVLPDQEDVLLNIVKMNLGQ